jgi:DNA-binding GntR family transcriptional regulator
LTVLERGYRIAGDPIVARGTSALQKARTRGDARLRDVLYVPNDDEAGDRVSDRVAQDLRRLVITLQLRPGEPIIEAQLMERLGCGRTPLREALHRVASEYLVRAVPRRGMTVTDIGVLELQQVYQARQGIEGLLAGVAAQQIAPEQLARLDALTRQMEKAGEAADLYETVQRDIDFHSALAEASGNRFLRDAFLRLTGLTMRLMFFAHSRGQAIAQTHVEHRQVLAAVQTRDPATAERTMHAHILAAKERILRTL